MIRAKSLYNSAESRAEVENDDIIFVLEETTEFMVSNSNMLNMLLILLKGVSDFDYNNETPVFENYVRILHTFSKELKCFN